jgi:predicted permease
MIRRLRRRADEDFSDEIRAHIELEVDRLIAEGTPLAEARSRAMRTFGNVASVKESFYERNHWVLLEQLLQDLRYAWRNLRQSPAFLLTTVLTLAVGLGLVTVLFTVFNAYVLRPFAVRDPGSLYKLAVSSPDGGTTIFRWRDYEELRLRSDLFAGVVAQSSRFVSSTGRPLAAVLVSGNYFDVLGPQFAIGRPLTASDAGAAVLSNQAWERLYGNDPDVLGRLLDVNGRPFAIVGVLAPTFTGLDEYPRDVWIPLTTYAAFAKPELTGSDQPHAIEVAARLRPDVSLVHASGALTADMARIAAGKRDVRAELMPASAPYPLSLELLAVLSPVFAAFGLVLVTVCANVSNVMLARAVARHREIAVRLSLGASRGRVIRQLLTEGLLIAALAGVAALVIAFWTLRSGVAMFFATLPPAAADIFRLVPLTIDHRVFLFALGAAAATTLLFALVPATKASRLTLTDALRGQRGASGRSRLRSALVVAQVAISLVLVVVAITLVRNASSLGRMRLGYEAAGVLSVNVRGEEHALVRDLATAAARDPHVAEVAVTNGNPLFVMERSVAAAPADGGTAHATRYTFVSPSYFSILQLPIVSGRPFTAHEAATSAGVAIVSAATAQAFWPGQGAVGRSVRIEPPNGRPVDELREYTHVTVVGVAPDVVSGLVVNGPDAGHIYLPATEASPRARAVLLRGRSADALRPQVLEGLFTRIARDPQVFEAIPLEDMRDLQMYPLAAASWIGAALALVALALSVAGLYGVLSYTLAQRTKEIGIRIALGASAAMVVTLVMRQSAKLAGIGAAAGLVIAFAAMKTLASVIRFETVSMLDGVAFAAALVLVSAATALAAFTPARRAAGVDPALTLRADG